MTYHILNGDSLAHTFKETDIAGEVVVVREALIDGNVSGGTSDEFWQNRANSLGITLEEYKSYTVSEFEKIGDAPDSSIFNLWFGYDLFCQANVWFVLHLIDSLPIQKEVYMVYPTFLAEKDKWKEFGQANAADLKTSLSKKTQFSEQDFKLAGALWRAYKNHDLPELAKLSEKKSDCFPYLKEVCEAHLERFVTEGMNRPERVLNSILQKGETDFHEVFRQFSLQEGVYGFGDLQIKPIYDKLVTLHAG